MDRRIKYTKGIIKETFLNLLEEKEVNKITVSEICKIADINRATFYRYYLDVYDLLEKIENEFIEELKQVPFLTNNEYSLSSLATELLNIFLENKKLVTIIFRKNTDIYILNDILEGIHNKYKYKWLNDFPDLDENEISYANIFAFNGSLGIVNYWIQQGFVESVEEISKKIEDFSYYGVKNYIYKNKEQ